jgi:hypothetical protein
MTQIIGAITKDYVLLASDRRLTLGDGPRAGELFDDDTCKLVSLCGICGIGYTGLASIEGQSTHQWIAKNLAGAGCRDAASADRTIVKCATAAFASVRRWPQAFLMAGWAPFVKFTGLRPHLCLITNMMDSSQRRAHAPLESFASFRKALRDEESSCCEVIGLPLSIHRARQLRRNIDRLAQRLIGPKEALRLLVDEIIHTSVAEKQSTVGSKVLGFCIPRKSAEAYFKTGRAGMLAVQPNLDAAAFTYFEDGYSELQQFGPTFVCGGTAFTDVKTENDPSRDFQSVEVHLLSLPKRKP